jgi:hypothetical protein
VAQCWAVGDQLNQSDDSIRRVENMKTTVKTPRFFVTMMALLLGVTSSAYAQSFNRFQDVPERSDNDFRVRWSDSDPFEVHDGPNYARRVHIAYMTELRGKGVLTQLEIWPNAADMMSQKCQSPINPSCTALITVSGLKDHHQCRLVMSAGQTFSRGVPFWKVGDIVSLDVSKIVRDDRNIPTIFDDPGNTKNVTANCQSAGCYLLTKKGSELRPVGEPTGPK